MPGNLEGRLVTEGILGETGGFVKTKSAIDSGLVYRQSRQGPMRNLPSPSWDRTKVCEWFEDFLPEYDATTLWNETDIQGTTVFTLLDNDVNAYNGVLDITTGALTLDGGQIQWNREKVFGPHLTLGADFWFHARIAIIDDPEYSVRVGMFDENANIMGDVDGVYFDIGGGTGHDVDCEINEASALTQTGANVHLLLESSTIQNKWLDLWIHWDSVAAEIRWYIGRDAILAATHSWSSGALASVVPSVGIRTVTAQASTVLVDFIHVIQERAGFTLAEAF